jgi:hypothetical protein
MIRSILPIAFACCLPALGAQSGQAPIYKVEQRSIPAINYGHRDEPTKIDFRGTVLLPLAKGDAKVEGKPGAVAIDAKFEGLPSPVRFGPRYLTYVLWAITPEGRPVNLGEVLPNASDKAKLEVTARLQAFGLLVTAEPYFSVTQPSNVVVLENRLRPDTEGKVEQVEARFELLRRDEYPAAPASVERPASANEERAVPMDRYEALLALYEAQNALQVARAQGADRYAHDTLQKADRLYAQAQNLGRDRSANKEVVTIAREAAQTAEDARTIALRREPAR